MYNKRKYDHISTQDLKTENNRLKNEIKTLTTRIEFIDRKTRHPNVVVNGLNCKNIGAAKSDFTELCKDTLDINVSIVNTSIINKNTVKFNLETQSMAQNVIMSKSKLRGRRIYIQKDYTSEEQQVRFNLRQLSKNIKDKDMCSCEQHQFLITILF